MKQDFSFLAIDGLQDLLDTLASMGYQCIGPRLKDETIQFEQLDNVSQLPKGVTQTQQPGQYQLHYNETDNYFAWANGPQAFKPYTFAARETLWRSQSNADGSLDFSSRLPATIKQAFIGVRACDLAALYLQDKHFLQGEMKDPYYAARRHDSVIIAVNCTHPAATCFCASTGDGPEVEFGYDLALTEIEAGFVVHIHSKLGQRIADNLVLKQVSQSQDDAARQAIEQAVTVQSRQLPATKLKESLFNSLHHSRWDEVAQRCLACGNCTMVCPTCFCHSESDDPALDGSSSQHLRQWDSCFTPGHSYIHGLTIRAETRHRYRQWLTHKFATWHEQYGRSGCVGCGRCITWCPVGIDVTEELTAICGGS